jgi:Ca2+-binding RTX toxin-like protein
MPVVTGTNADDVLYGTVGDDTLQGLWNYDWLFGSAGNDSLDGGTEIDVVIYDTLPGSIVADLGTGRAVKSIGGTDTLVGIENIHGTALADRLTLSPVGGYAMGRSGNDTLTGAAERDQFLPGSGNDSIDGRDGYDWLEYLDDGNDSAGASSIGVAINVFTGTATDNWGGTDRFSNIEEFRGTRAADVILAGGSLGDLFIRFIGRDGADTMDGAGNLNVEVAYQADPGAVIVDLAAGTGRDGYGFTDRLFNLRRVQGSDFADTISGDAADNILSGGGGHDRVLGGAGGDTLRGAQGDDTLLGQDGHDLLNGDTGHDRAEGGAGNDTLFGEDGNDVLFGEAADDQLIGGNGADSLYGQDGADVLFGENDNDLLAGGAGMDTLFGQAGQDTLAGEAGDDTLVGGDGQDQLLGQDGPDQLFGEAGHDILIGGAEGDTLLGQAGDDNLFGETGADVLAGGDGQDNLYGQEGDDSLYGEAGNDVLWAGFGQDVVSGGAGADIIYFAAPNQGTDMVFDFNRAEGDRLYVQASGFSAPAGFQLTAGTGFHSGAGVRPTANTATFYHDTSTQALWFDPDGTGGAGAHVVAFMMGGPALLASDIVFV